MYGPSEFYSVTHRANSALYPTLHMPNEKFKIIYFILQLLTNIL